MKKKGKKYLIKESELKEIIREMLLMEIYNPGDTNIHTQYYTGKMPNIGDVLGGAGNIFSGLLGRIIPDGWKERVANGDNDLWQYILGLLGAQKAGTTRADWVPNIGQHRGEGSNADASQPLNVNVAVNWLRNHANPRYDKNKCGACAKYVRMALNRGGLQVPHGMAAPSAKYYLNILPTNGWEEIPVNQAGELGDVVVIDDCVDSNNNRHKYGHIAMCIGNGVWASDFIQKTMHGLAGEPPPSAVHVFRYRNRI